MSQPILAFPRKHFVKGRGRGWRRVIDVLILTFGSQAQKCLSSDIEVTNNKNLKCFVRRQDFYGK
jgi:hypothetical protein